VQRHAVSHNRDHSFPYHSARRCNHHHSSSRYIGILIAPDVAIDKDFRSHCPPHTTRYDPRDCRAIPQARIQVSIRLDQLQPLLCVRINDRLKCPFNDRRHRRRHARGGLTANSLVVSSSIIRPTGCLTGKEILPNGTYLELISFTRPDSHHPPSSPSHDTRHNHPRANKANDWVAYTFLGTPNATLPLSAILNARLQAAGSDVYYDPEVTGGRTRPDGVEIKWELSTPARWGRMWVHRGCRSSAAISRR
jgi:hypothetical protein